MNELEREHDREVERETYSAIYAVPDLVVRTAILRLYSQMQSDRNRAEDRIAKLETNERNRQQWFAVLRWMQTFITAIITALAIYAAERAF